MFVITMEERMGVGNEHVRRAVNSARVVSENVQRLALAIVGRRRVLLLS